MRLLDWILNLACVLMWFNWRWARLASLDKPSPVSLAATLKKAGPRRQTPWVAIVSLVAILAIRSLFYWYSGPALNWTPSLELGVITLPFRSDYLDRMLLYSGLSFGLVVAGLYAWLLLLSIVNRRLPNGEPGQRLVRWHLGWVESWPAWLKFLLPMGLTMLIWGLANPALVRLGIVPAPVSRSHLWQQALLLGVNSFLSWEALVVAICVLYLVNSYVYLGNSYFWAYVNLTGANLLAPLRRLGLCIGKVDVSPVLAIALILTLAHWASRRLPALFQSLPL
jgi:uncharacterized protein YggT (Ycf19 family)